MSPRSPTRDRDVRAAAPLCKARVLYECRVVLFLLLNRHFIQVFFFSFFNAEIRYYEKIYSDFILLLS